MKKQTYQFKKKGLTLKRKAKADSKRVKSVKTKVKLD